MDYMSWFYIESKVVELSVPRKEGPSCGWLREDMGYPVLCWLGNLALLD